MKSLFFQGNFEFFLLKKKEKKRRKRKKSKKKIKKIGFFIFGYEFWRLSYWILDGGREIEFICIGEKIQKKKCIFMWDY